ncbi:fatty acid desaturase [Pleurocapsales cyanobacterium LEGE 10410]|nr:fatty acid desaturase [Pleurocapsales cyanobacterium LEGE 10410]
MPPVIFSQSMSDETAVNLANPDSSLVSLTIAITILFLWFASLIFFLRLDLSNLSLILIILGMWLRSFLHTGIFIIIHESIHGVVAQNQRVNDFMGYLASFLYALLPYKTLTKNHRQHHRCPATTEDPDFYPADPNNFFLWYGSFMKDYQKGMQFWILFWGMTVFFWIFIFLHIAIANIFLFWVIPIVISSLQLFTFGIFLPHRHRKEGYRDRHRAKSNDYPVFLSFITCYHFGYHWEHHQYPHLPWYRLPLARQKA